MIIRSNLRNRCTIGYESYTKQVRCPKVCTNESDLLVAYDHVCTGCRKYIRPILAMVGSAQHATAQWLAELLKPVLQRYSNYVIKDSFEFSEMMKKFAPKIEGHMCSYDIVSLFTNVPLEETIGICTKALYHSDEPPPPLKVWILTERQPCVLSAPRTYMYVVVRYQSV